MNNGNPAEHKGGEGVMATGSGGHQMPESGQGIGGKNILSFAQVVGNANKQTGSETNLNRNRDISPI